jgi:hypothetical protein
MRNPSTSVLLTAEGTQAYRKELPSQDEDEQRRAHRGTIAHHPCSCSLLLSLALYCSVFLTGKFQSKEQASGLAVGVHADSLACRISVFSSLRRRVEHRYGRVRDGEWAIPDA